MSRIAYVNGRYLPLATAAVSINDRAFNFGDGAYEVCEVRDGALIDEAGHLARLGRSLAALRISWPIAKEALRVVMRETIRRNRVRDGLVYLQVSRGAARRDHGFPEGGATPGLIVTARSLDSGAGAARAASGVAVITAPDERWAHPHIKTLQLLPNVLAKQAAREAGAFEAWFIDRDGFVGFAAAQLHERLIDGDTHDPGVELGIALELVEVLIGLHEGLLEHVFGILAILRDVLGQPEDLALIAPHQFAKCTGIARARLRN